MKDISETLRDLAMAKAIFQQRTVEMIVTEKPASMTANLASKTRAELMAEAEKAEQERQRLASRFGASQKWQYKSRDIKRKSTTPDKANDYGYAGRLK